MKFKMFYESVKKMEEKPEKEKRVVVSFGRFNPPTQGHLKLVDVVKKIAGGDDWYVIPSQSYDGIGSGRTVSKRNKKPMWDFYKNPIHVNDKIKLMKKLLKIPSKNTFVKSDIKTVMDVLFYMVDLDYTDIVVVAGSDRITEFKTLFDKYIPKYADDHHKHVNITVVSSGERDPDSDDTVSKMSGTKARKSMFLQNVDNMSALKSATGWTGGNLKTLYDLLHKEMVGK